jgi:hypothetical protein
VRCVVLCCVALSCLVARRFENQHPAPAAGPRLSGALSSLLKGGEEAQKYNEGSLEALYADMGTGIGKQNAVRLREG